MALQGDCGGRNTHYVDSLLFSRGQLLCAHLGCVVTAELWRRWLWGYVDEDVLDNQYIC